MAIDNRGPFPRETVRDLLGITRALYRAERHPANLGRLEEIGKHFRLALELAAKCEQGTMGRRAAWGWAEKGANALGELVGDSMSIAPAVQASVAKFRGR